GNGTAILASLLLLCSPFFLFMSGSMMSHPAGLASGTLGLLLTVAASRRENSWLPLGAGLAFGWLTASRQLTGLAMTGPALIWLAAERWRSRRTPRSRLMA